LRDLHDHASQSPRKKVENGQKGEQEPEPGIADTRSMDQQRHRMTGGDAEQKQPNEPQCIAA